MINLLFHINAKKKKKQKKERKLVHILSFLNRNEKKAKRVQKMYRERGKKKNTEKIDLTYKPTNFIQCNEAEQSSLRPDTGVAEGD